MDIQSFDITQLDSGAFDSGIPDRLRRFLLKEAGLERKLSCEDQAEECRLQLVTNALVAVNLLNKSKPPRWAQNLEDLILGDGEYAPAQVRTQCNLRYIRLDSWIVIQLPRIVSSEHCQRVISDLNDLYDLQGSAHQWILDFSAVDLFPSELFAYLIGFNRGLKLLHQEIVMLWMRRDFIPASLLPAVSRHFNLVKRGTFLIPAK